MRPDQPEFAEGLRLAVIAAVSAVVTATAVIGVGRSLLPEPPATIDAPPLIRASVR